MIRADRHMDSKQILRIFVIPCWLLTKILSYKLWLADHSFPMAPITDLTNRLPAIIHNLLLWGSLACMLIFLARPQKWILTILLTLELLSCLGDQNRWQPWEYFFLFFTAAYIFVKQPDRQVSGWKWMLGGLYFFSGLYKIGNGFIHDVWQNLVLIRWLGFHDINPWLLRFGYSLGLVEMMAGIGILFAASRKISAGILILMHLWILLVIGPAGIGINSVVWPWNLLMICLLYVLFLAKKSCALLSPVSNGYHIGVLIAWWLLPWLHMFGKWDNFLSSALYSGGVPQLYICPGNEKLSAGLSQYSIQSVKGIPCEKPVSYYQWGMQELNIVPNEEIRIYQSAIKNIGRAYPGNNRYYLVRHGFKTTVQEIFPSE